MSGTRTENLGLFNTNMLTDGDDFWDFDRDLNQNNNILDAAIGKLSTLTTEQKASLVAAINELVAGKSSIDLDNLSEIGQAIMDKKVEVEALLQQNGYAKFTWKENNEISSFIIQWGTAGVTGSTVTSFNFPIDFNTAYQMAVATRYVNGNYSSDVSIYGNRSKSRLSVYLNGSGSGFTIMWFAIGY